MLAGRGFATLAVLALIALACSVIARRLGREPRKRTRLALTGVVAALLFAAGLFAFILAR